MKKKLIKFIIAIFLGIGALTASSAFFDHESRIEYQDVSILEIKEAVKVCKLQSYEIKYKYTRGIERYARAGNFIKEVFGKECKASKDYVAYFCYDLSNLDIIKRDNTFFINLDKNNISLSISGSNFSIDNNSGLVFSDEKLKEINYNMDKEVRNDVFNDANINSSLESTKEGLSGVLDKLNVNYEINY